MLDLVLRTVPLWLLGVLLIGACMVACDAGALVRHHFRRTRPGGDGPGWSEAQSYVVGPIFGLLAFVLGITFSIALDRFEDRRSGVAEEAAAISTTHLRANLLDEPHRTTLQATLHAYARARIAPTGLWNADMQARHETSVSLRHRLWRQTQAAVFPIRDTELAASFVEAMTETLAAGGRRDVAARAAIPTRIFAVLFIYLVSAALVLGYVVRGGKGMGRGPPAGMFALFVIMIITILDIDRPRAGSIQVPQVAMEELVQALEERDEAVVSQARTSVSP